MYLDMAVSGRYDNLVWKFLEEHDAIPQMEEGDMDIMKEGKPDFIQRIKPGYYKVVTLE